MSDFTQKHYRSLMEAYASIYQQPNQVIEEQVEEEICFGDLEVDNDLMVDLIVDRLIVEGYANTDNQALNMIPHMSDVWLDTVVGNFVIEQNFIETINSILEEGYDLSSYTVDELYEEYVGHFNNYLNEDYRTDLHEVVPLLAAPLLANPATLAAGAGLAAGAAYAGKKAYDAYRQMKSGTSAEGEKWLETGSYGATKPQTTLRSQGDINLGGTKTRPPGQPGYPGEPGVQSGYEKGNVTLKGKTSTEKINKGPSGGSSGGGPSGGGGGGTPPGGGGPSGGGGGGTPPGGGGPKGPNWFQRTASDFAKAFKQSASKPPSGGGTPPSGPTKPNPFVTAAGKVGGALYQGARPILKAATVGSGALGAGLGVAGVADELAFRGAGRTALRKTLEFTRQAGPAMRGEKPAPAPTPPSSGSQGMTPMFKNGKIVGYK